MFGSLESFINFESAILSRLQHAFELVLLDFKYLIALHEFIILFLEDGILPDHLLHLLKLFLGQSVDLPIPIMLTPFLGRLDLLFTLDHFSNLMLLLNYALLFILPLLIVIGIGFCIASL
jgi:hypothetical protein